jgi:hypothetical protein
MSEPWGTAKAWGWGVWQFLALGPPPIFGRKIVESVLASAWDPGRSASKLKKHKFFEGKACVVIYCGCL